MGYTKDLWTRPEKQPDGKVKRVPNARHGKGKRWLACWLDPEGAERSQAFKAKTVADKHWAKMETDRERGEYYDPRAGDATLDSVVQRWLSSLQADPTTRREYERAYRLRIKAAFGARPVKVIKPSVVQSWQADLHRKFANSTVAKARVVLLGALDLAVADDLIKKNPVRSKVVKPPSKDGGEKIQAWSEQRVNALIDAHSDDLRLLPIIGATCGLRESELYGLAEEDIDFEAQLVHVRRQIKKLGSSYVFALPKGGKERDVPLPAWTAEWCRTHIAGHPPRPCSLPWVEPTGRLRTHRILFRWTDGGHIKSRSFSESVWKPALVVAGVIPQPAPGRDKAKPSRDKISHRVPYATTRREGLHQLRHHYASVMLAGGVSIKELAEYLGHTDPGFTLRVYAHLLPDSHDRARQVIDGHRFRPRAVSDGTLTERGLRRATV